MEEVNRDFLAHKGDTDVICFDYRHCEGTCWPAEKEKKEEAAPGRKTDGTTVPGDGRKKEGRKEEGEEEEVLVDLLLCPAVAEREAAKRNLPYSRELALYLVHGLLHASGYDDLRPDLKRKMRRAEKRVMNALEEEFSFPSVFPPPLPPPQPAPAPFFPEEGKEKKPRSGRKLFPSPTEKETKTAAPCRKTPHRSRSINTTLEH